MWNLRQYAYHVVAFCARVLLLCLVSIAPWLYAGAAWHHQMLLVQAAWVLTALTILSVVLSPGRATRVHSILWGLVGLVFVGCVQSAPLPSALADRISGASPFVRQLQNLEVAVEQGVQRAPGGVDVAFDVKTISVDPVQTRATLAVFCAAIMVIWSSSVLFADKNWAIVLLVVLAVGGTANAFVGLMQAVSWNHWTLLPMKGKNYFATFVSRNSAPQYFAVATSAALALLGFSYRRQRRLRRKEFRMRYPSASIVERVRRRLEEVFVDLDALSVGSFACAAFCILGTAATSSRGGVLATVGAAALTLLVTLGTRGHVMRAWIGAGVLAVFVTGAMVGFGLDAPLLERMDELNETAYAGGDGRTIVWTYAFRSLSWYALFGSGLGSFHFALLPFHDHGPNVWFYHGESIPVELFTETGLVGFGIGLWIVVRLVALLRKHIVLDQEKLLLTAVVFAVSAVGFQSAVDFSLILPGIFLPLGALVGAFCARAILHDSSAAGDSKSSKGRSKEGKSHSASDHAHHRWNSMRVIEHTVFASLLSVVSVTGFSSLVGYVDAERTDERLAELLKDVRSSDSYPDVAATQALLTDLNQSIDLHPSHPELMLLKGKVAQAAWRSHVLSTWDWPKELNTSLRFVWSDPAILCAALRGEVDEPAGSVLRDELRKDAAGAELAEQASNAFRTAWSRSPLDWRAAFGTAVADRGELSSTARARVRRGVELLAGNNSKLILDVGISALRHGDFQQGKELIQHAVGMESRHLMTALPVLADRLPAEDVIAMLPADPKFQALVAVSMSRSKNWETLRDPLFSRLSGKYAEVESATLEEWNALAWVASELKDVEQELAFLRRAVAASPLKPEVRFRLATRLAATGRKKEAIEELERCKAQDRSNGAYRQMLDELSGVLDR